MYGVTYKNKIFRGAQHDRHGSRFGIFGTTGSGIACCTILNRGAEFAKQNISMGVTATRHRFDAKECWYWQYAILPVIFMKII